MTMAQQTVAEKALVGEVTQLFNTAKSARGLWESHWQQIADLVLPRNGTFQHTGTPGEKRTSQQFDAAPANINNTLAAGLHGMMTNPATKWFSLAAVNPELAENRDVQKWLDQTRKDMFAVIHAPMSGFSTAVHEVYLELAAFGTGVLFITDREADGDSGVGFQSVPLAECFIYENHKGHIDTLFRKYTQTAAQLVRRWGADKVSESTRKKFEGNDPNSRVDCIHAVYPRVMANRKARGTPKNKKPFASVYIELGDTHLLDESGFDEFPYMVPRFYKYPGEHYGRGPGMVALPDIRMLNQMAKTIIIAGQKAADPLMVVPDDGVVGTIKNVPGGILYYRAGPDNRPSFLETGRNLPITINEMQRLEVKIKEAFFVDMLSLGQRPQMTATEVVQRTEENLRLLGPVFGRLQAEFLGPMIDRVFAIMQRQGLITSIDLPEEADISFVYESPIARAQRQLEAAGIQRSMEVLAPFIASDPQLMDNFDSDVLVPLVVVDLQGVPAKVLRSKADIDAIRQSRSEQQQMQQMGTLAVQAGQATNQFAQAGAAREGL